MATICNAAIRQEVDCGDDQIKTHYELILAKFPGLLTQSNAALKLWFAAKPPPEETHACERRRARNSCSFRCPSVWTPSSFATVAAAQRRCLSCLGPVRVLRQNADRDVHTHMMLVRCKVTALTVCASLRSLSWQSASTNVTLWRCAVFATQAMNLGGHNSRGRVACVWM